MRSLINTAAQTERGLVLIVGPQCSGKTYMVWQLKLGLAHLGRPAAYVPSYPLADGLAPHEKLLTVFGNRPAETAALYEEIVTADDVSAAFLVAESHLVVASVFGATAEEGLARLLDLGATEEQIHQVLVAGFMAAEIAGDALVDELKALPTNQSRLDILGPLEKEVQAAMAV